MRTPCSTKLILALASAACGGAAPTPGPADAATASVATAQRSDAGATVAAGHSGSTAAAMAVAASAGKVAVEPARAGSGGRVEATPRAGAGAGGTQAAGESGGASGGSSAPSCTRMLLQSSVDAYFTALAAHDPASLPVADHVKLTENGKAIELGKSGLWTSAGTLQHAHSALDTDACTALVQAVVPDGSTPIPLALRLKLEQAKITEIEMIAVRAGDYMLASNTQALSASAMTVGWEEPVPPNERNTRAELSAWMEKYFRMFPRGVCAATSDCIRIENGGGSFNCSAGASCAANAPGASDNALKPRLILADVETGLGVGFTMFQSNTDMHMFKMRGGKVYGVSAILGKADKSGWE